VRLHYSDPYFIISTLPGWARTVASATVLGCDNALLTRVDAGCVCLLLVSGAIATLLALSLAAPSVLFNESESRLA
jgi:hypothetical protein